MPLFFPPTATSLDDIVFEGRNQAYGAYQLRQAYKQHLASAGGLTAALCTLLFVGGLAWQHLAPVASVLTEPLTPVEVAPIYVAQVPKHAVVAPHQPAKAVPTRPVATLPTQVVRDNTPLPTPKLAAVLEASRDDPASLATGSTSEGPPATGPANSGPTDATVGDVVPAVTGPYLVVEKMPEFAGGQAALLRYLQKMLRYPAPALAAQAEGRVFLSFVVQADGSIADVTILKGLGYGLDEEALRVVRQMPAWTPGYQSKHAVPVRFTLPITFKVQ